MLVMEHLYGSEHVRKFLKEELDTYLRARGSEEVAELPHDQVEDQGYIDYRKGAVVMYRLKEAVGEDVVDRSPRRLRAQYDFKGAPYPSLKDFIKTLREEAGPKFDALITDLFDKIALYDLTATSATWTKRSDGKLDVAVTVDAHKYNADGKGMQTEVEMNEPVAIGLFLAKPGDADFDNGKILTMVPRSVVSSRQTLHVTTATAPKVAEVDPPIVSGSTAISTTMSSRRARLIPADTLCTGAARRYGLANPGNREFPTPWIRWTISTGFCL